MLLHNNVINKQLLWGHTKRARSPRSGIVSGKWKPTIIREIFQVTEPWGFCSRIVKMVHESLGNCTGLIVGVKRPMSEREGGVLGEIEKERERKRERGRERERERERETCGKPLYCWEFEFHRIEAQ